MPQVSGRALSEALSRAVDAQSRVINAAREAAALARQEVRGEASPDPERNLETGGPEVPAPAVNGPPSGG